MYLHGVGMVTPVGLTAAATCAAMRARVASFYDTPYVDMRGQPIIGAPVRAIVSRRKGITRLVDLAVPALMECVRSANIVKHERLALLLGLAEPERPGQSKTGGAELLSLLREATQLDLGPESEVITQGAASSLMSLATAKLYLTEERVDCCIVGGVDSYLSLEVVRWLESSRRLKRPGNSDGLIPGEAASFTAWRKLPPSRNFTTKLLGLGIVAEEDQAKMHVGGIALSKAMRQSLNEARLQPGKVTCTISDVTGEREGFMEHAIATIRVLTDPLPYLHRWHPASSVGSIGAACGACMLIWADEAARRHYSPGSITLCLASSAVGPRVAALLESGENSSA